MSKRVEVLARLAAGERASDVARAMGVSRQAVHQWATRPASRRVRQHGKTWWAPLLRDLREGQGLTVGEAAGRAGITFETWVRWERGQNAPSLPLFEAALGALDHDLEVLPR